MDVILKEEILFKLITINLHFQTGLLVLGGKLVTEICKLPVFDHVCNWLEQ